MTASISRPPNGPLFEPPKKPPSFAVELLLQPLFLEFPNPLTLPKHLKSKNCYLNCPSFAGSPEAPIFVRRSFMINNDLHLQPKVAVSALLAHPQVI